MKNRSYPFKQQVLKRFEDNSYASETVTVKWVFALTFVYRPDDTSQNVRWNVFKVDKVIENMLQLQSEEGWKVAMDEKWLVH